MNRLKRRPLLGLGGATLLGGAIGLTGCRGAASGGDGDGSIQFAWWGNDERDARTRDAIQAFEAQNSDISVSPQITNWDGYWDKLATQTAGGNPPDLIQMDYAFISEYAERGVLLELDDYIPEQLDVSDFSEDALVSGRIDAAMYGINMGINSFALIYNEQVLADVGLEMPDNEMTWSEFADLVKQIAADTPEDAWGSTNGMLTLNPLECWLLQRGKALYTEDGQLGFEPDDLLEWFEFWDGLMTDGAVPPAEVETALSGDLADSFIVAGRTAFEFVWSNQLTAFNEASQDSIGIHMFPQGDEPDSGSGQYYKASMLISVAAESSDPDSAVQLANALLTEPDIAAELGFERGVPPSPAVVEQLMDDATEYEQTTTEYIDMLADRITDTPPPPPQGNTEVEQAFEFATEEAVFGRMSHADAVDKFFTDATDTLD